MKDQIATAVIIGVGASILGWATWITLAVFDFKTRLALMEQELEVMNDIKTILAKIETKLTASERV